MSDASGESRLQPTLDQVSAYLNAAGWQRQSEREYNAQLWHHPERDGGMLVYDQDVDERGLYPVYGSGLLELLADYEGRCGHEVLADMLGEVDAAAALARMAGALDLAFRYGGTDESHHRAWVIDQMVRALTGGGYEQWVAEHNDGEDGPDSYEWDEGIVP